jgi:hypothetical protein
MIEICDLTKADKGRWVKLKNLPGKEKSGRIKTWNDRFIFVVFNCDNDWENYTDYTAEAVHWTNLEFTEKESEGLS